MLSTVAVSASAGVVSVGDGGRAFGGAVRSSAAGPFGDGATATSSSPPATAAAQRVEGDATPVTPSFCQLLQSPGEGTTSKVRDCPEGGKEKCKREPDGGGLAGLPLPAAPRRGRGLAAMPLPAAPRRARWLRGGVHHRRRHGSCEKE